MIKRKLGEQWAEKAEDGKMHMYKAINGGCDECCHYCDGLYLCVVNGNMCPVLDTIFGMKDLGILNKDGCLPSSWGEYPEIIDFGDGSYVEVNCLLRKDSKILKAEYAYGDTRQEAIDNWNRKA